jgi:hypothetical protein
MTHHSEPTFIRFCAVASGCTVAVAAFHYSGGLSLQSMDAAAGTSLSRLLSVLGLWLTLVAPTALVSSYVSRNELDRVIPATLLGCFSFAVVVSTAMFAFGMNPPVEAMSLVDLVIGTVALTKAITINDRVRVVLSGACVIIGIVGFCGWWLVSFGGSKVFETAVLFSEVRSDEVNAMEMASLRLFAPIYMNAMMHLACLPLMLVTVLSSLKIASICGRSDA